MKNIPVWCYRDIVTFLIVESFIIKVEKGLIMSLHYLFKVLREDVFLFLINFYQSELIHTRYYSP